MLKELTSASGCSRQERKDLVVAVKCLFRQRLDSRLLLLSHQAKLGKLDYGLQGIAQFCIH